MAWVGTSPQIIDFPGHASDPGNPRLAPPGRLGHNVSPGGRRFRRSPLPPLPPYENVHVGRVLRGHQPGMRAWADRALFQWQVSPPPIYELADLRLTVVGPMSAFLMRGMRGEGMRLEGRLDSRRSSDHPARLACSACAHSA